MKQSSTIRLMVSIGLGLLWISYDSIKNPLRAGEKLDVNQQCSAELLKPVEWDGEIIFTLTAPYKTNVLRVWIPVLRPMLFNRFDAQSSRRFLWTSNLGLKQSRSSEIRSRISSSLIHWGLLSSRIN